MGRKVLGSVAAALAFSAALFFSGSALAQAAPEPAPPQAGAELPPAPQPEPPAPSVEPPSSPFLSNPPPLDPPPPIESPQRPGFLRTREELEDLKPSAAALPRASLPRPDFVTRSSPWADFSLASFYLKNRAGNFLNFGAQVGGYFFEHLRLSARLVVPTERVTDGREDQSFAFSSDGSTFTNTTSAPSRNLSLLYGASVGFVLSNGRSFVFGPNIGFVRSDVEDYGTAVMVGLPFEWTTSRNLRVGFEVSLGHASGGKTRNSCVSNTFGISRSCGVTASDREGGTAFMVSYNMGWSLGKL